MNLIAKLPTIAAIVYRNNYKEGTTPEPIESDLDWSGNFCNMLGFEDKTFTELMRLYLTIHRYLKMSDIRSLSLNSLQVTAIIPHSIQKTLPIKLCLCLSDKFIDISAL